MSQQRVETLAVLVGTPKQVQWAEALRRRYLAWAREQHRDDIPALLLRVTDATWFIAQAVKDRDLNEFQQPSPHQLQEPAS